MKPSTLVLLVEDDPIDAMVARRTLLAAKTEYEIDIASSIGEAIQCMSQRKHDVILSDLGLPDAGDLDAVTKIRNECDDVPLIVMSGCDDERLYVETLAKGADDFVSKHNLTPTTLCRCINQNIERMRQKREIQELVEAVETQREVLEQQADELQQKNLRLAALCQSAKSFVNNVSHEFRTPLCVIKQYSGMMSQGMFGELTDPQQHFLRVIEDRVDGLNNLVDDMLDISRYESGMLAASRKKCAIDEIIRRELTPLVHRGKVRSVKVFAECPDDLPNVFCDPEKVGRTIVNLVVNAIKVSSAEGQVRVSVSPNDETQEIEIRVHDDGPGMNDKLKKKLCGRFAQGPTSLLSNEKGFGLGLSITKELVDLNLGALEIESEVGVGSVFMFTIPYANPTKILSRYLERLGRIPENVQTELSVIRVRIDPTSDDDSADDVERFLNYTLRARDLAMPIYTNEWMVILDSTVADLPVFLTRFNSELTEVNRNRPQGELPAIHLHELGTFHRVDQITEIQNCLSGMLAPAGRPRKPHIRKAQYV
ncbi:hybrid sensor histidine kinase/response regulator [Neorhodopirellula lusitana]